MALDEEINLLLRVFVEYQSQNVVQLHFNFVDSVRETQRFGADLAALDRIVSADIAVMPRARPFPYMKKKTKYTIIFFKE